MFARNVSIHLKSNMHRMNVANLNWGSQFPRLLWFHRECPLCNSIEFEMAESGAMDGPLSWFALAPYFRGKS